MFPILFLSVLALATAAPRYSDYPLHRPWHNDYHDGYLKPYYEDSMFNTPRFWMEFEREMRNFEKVLEEFYKEFPSNFNQEGIDGDNYKITITLNGFDANDITVKAREGLVMVQAINSHTTYLDIKTLPDNVNATGTWTYVDGKLEILFPLKDKPKPEEDGVASTTEKDEEERSREEMDVNNSKEVSNVDIGLEETKTTKAPEVSTGGVEITETPKLDEQKVEATTYAVDLNNEVEFVPIRY